MSFLTNAALPSYKRPSGDSHATCIGIDLKELNFLSMLENAAISDML